MNILLEYLYRDAGNNKFSGEFVFSNKAKMTVACVEAAIHANLIDECFFVAEKVVLPTLYPHEYERTLDHGWHEFSYVEETSREVDAFPEQDIQEFLNRLKLMSIIRM